MKKKVYVALKIAIVVSALMFVLVALNQEVQTSNQQVEKENQTSQLNVALVNEDNGVQTNGNEFYLGSNYIKKIEKDTAHKWYIVSRGVAENGLKNGTYQLLVTIPSNFSEKILEIDKVDPERVDVTYKVNSNGNAQIENESNKVGSKIVNELNQQLVDMYVASILDNLYSAQVNINRVSTNQNETVGSYKDQVLQPAVDFQTNLPALVTQSDSAVQSNELLTKTLNGHTDTLSSFNESQQQFETTLDKLLSFRAEGKLTYEEFVATLIEMDQQLLNQETVSTYERLKETSQNISTSVGRNKTDGGFSADLEKMNQKLQEEQTTVTNELDKLTVKITSVTEDYLVALYNQFGITWNPTEPRPKITLEDVLIKGPDKPLIKNLKQTKDDIANNKVIADTRLKGLIKELPRLDRLELTEYNQFLEKLYKVNVSNINVPQDVDDKLTKINNILDTHPDLAIDAGSGKGENSTYLQELDIAIINLNAANDFDLSKERKIIIDNISGIETGKILLTIPSEVEILRVENGIFDSTTGQASFTNVNNLTIVYNYNSLPSFNPVPVMAIQLELEEIETPPVSIPVLRESQEDQELAQNSPIEPQQDVAQTALTWKWKHPLDVTNANTQNYIEAVRVYSELVGRIQELYARVYDLLDDYNNSVYDSKNIEMLLTLDFRDYFQGILISSVTKELENQQTTLLDLNQKGENIAGEMTGLDESLGVIQNHTVELQEDVLKQLELLGEWQKNMSGIVSSETKISAVNSQTDQEVMSNKETMSTILSMTQALKESSGQNVQESESVKSIFTNFTQEVTNAQENGKSLAANANEVMAKFEEELATNNDFVGAFVKVLNNAHQEGVANDVLLQFIANPVNGRSEQAVKSAEVYKPFTWILIIFVVSFFTGYIFANQEVVQKAQNVFRNDRLWISDNILATALVTGSSILLGLVIGTISQRSLEIPKEQELIWITVVTFLTIIFTLLNHFLMKQFKTIGVGIGLFLLISYVFLTNAIGKTAVLSNFSENVKNINPLSKSEGLLMTFFSNNSIGAGPVIVLVVVIVLLVIANLIIWQPKISFGGWGKKDGK